MPSRKAGRRRRIPHRTCVGCRQVGDKRSLTRIVRGPGGVQIDLTGKAPGRGAYLHQQETCWENALKGSLGRALRIRLTKEELEDLSAYMNRLKNDQPN